jgi:hypothetical protein
MPARMLGRITLALVTIALVIAALLAAGTRLQGAPHRR